MKMKKVFILLHMQEKPLSYRYDDEYSVTVQRID